MSSPSEPILNGERVTFYPTATDPSPTAKLFIYNAGPYSYSFREMRAQMAYGLVNAPKINRGQWQTLDVSASPLHDTHELRNVSIFYTVPDTEVGLQNDVGPDLPWAEQHFQERVSGFPYNPPPSHVNWPYHGTDKVRHLDDLDKFSHTYPERFWPNGGREFSLTGYRFDYGDLDGVVAQLVANPLTRQAVLPVWFPEDTGAVGRRVPCSLTYHFMADEDNRLSVWYTLRACDFYRHFHNDVYFAARLLQWVCTSVAGGIRDKTGEYNGPTVGELNMTISSLHLFAGDVDKVTS